MGPSYARYTVVVLIICRACSTRRKCSAFFDTRAVMRSVSVVMDDEKMKLVPCTKTHDCLKIRAITVVLMRREKRASCSVIPGRKECGNLILELISSFRAENVLAQEPST